MTFYCLFTRNYPYCGIRTQYGTPLFQQNTRFL